VKEVQYRFEYVPNIFNKGIEIKKAFADFILQDKVDVPNDFCEKAVTKTNTDSIAAIPAPAPPTPPAPVTPPSDPANPANPANPSPPADPANGGRRLQDADQSIFSSTYSGNSGLASSGFSYTQTFSIEFTPQITAKKNPISALSGNPGYTTGSPLIIG